MKAEIELPPELVDAAVAAEVRRLMAETGDLARATLLKTSEAAEMFRLSPQSFEVFALSQGVRPLTAGGPRSTRWRLSSLVSMLDRLEREEVTR